MVIASYVIAELKRLCDRLLMLNGGRLGPIRMAIGVCLVSTGQYTESGLPAPGETAAKMRTRHHVRSGKISFIPNGPGFDRRDD